MLQDYNKKKKCMYCNDKVGRGCVLGGVTMVSVIYWGFDDKYNLQFIFIYWLWTLDGKLLMSLFFAEN